jgi:hypothetical protein
MESTFNGYPGKLRAAKTDRLSGTFAIFPLAMLRKLGGKAAVLGTLLIQARIEGASRIVPWAAWKDALGMNHRNYWRRMVALEAAGLVRRKSRGAGRSPSVSLLGVPDAHGRPKRRSTLPQDALFGPSPVS